MRRAAVLVLLVAAVPGIVGAVGEDPAAEVTEALRRLGPPGGVWGRLAVEEESPVGAWTPLADVEITLYPATPALVAELDRIRQSARASAAQYESAVSWAQAALAAHQGRVDRQSPSPAAPSGGAASPEPPPHPWRQKTDPAGIFAFDAVPSGDWIVVAIRVSPYSAEKLRSDPKPRQAARTAQRFLSRPVTPPKEAELWITRIRVIAGERVALDLSDRARWLVGPVR
jgi:hypothetical protein